MHTGLKYGIVSEYKPGYAKVYFAMDDIVSDWFPIVMHSSVTDKQSWPLNVKEPVVCLCDARCEEGVVLGAIHNKVQTPDSGAGTGLYRKVFEDGTVLEYDKLQHKLTANVQGGDIDIECSGNARINAGIDLFATVAGAATITAPTITLQGDVIITGTATVISDLVAGSIATTGGGAITGTGSMTVTGVITAANVIGGGKSLAGHTHPIPGGNTGSPN